MRFIKYFILTILCFYIKQSLAQSGKTIKYEVEVYSIDEYDYPSKTWKKGEFKDGNSLIMVVFPETEKSIFIFWGEKHVYKIYNASSEEHGKDTYGIFKTIDKEGNEVTITIIFWEDHSRTMTIELTGKRINFGLKILP